MRKLIRFASVFLLAAGITVAIAPPASAASWYIYASAGPCAGQTYGQSGPPCLDYIGSIPEPWRIHIDWTCQSGYTGYGNWWMNIANGNTWVGQTTASPGYNAGDFYGDTSYVNAGAGSEVTLWGTGPRCVFNVRIGHFGTPGCLRPHHQLAANDIRYFC